MSAKDLMRQQLAELLGSDAMGMGAPLKETSDKRNCPMFLAGLCPHTLFANTKMDFGPCEKKHSEAMQELYQKELEEGKSLGYEIDTLEYLSSLVRSVDMDIASKKKQLLEDNGLTMEESLKMSEIQAVIEEIGEKLALSTKLAGEGQVEESFKINEELGQLRKKREQLEAEFQEMSTKQLNVQQKLQVCEVCGLHVSALDNDVRLADHFGGRLHTGYIKLRQFVKEQTAKLGSRRRERPSAGRERRERSRSRDRRDRRRSRSRSRDRRDRRRSRSRSRDRRDRRRSRSRSRDRRDRRDRYRRDRYDDYDDDRRDRYSSSRRHHRSSHRRSRSRSRSPRRHHRD